ncbi:MAG TPA: riboflavin synthase subunit alpha [Candidatus Thalassarchaeaceae archaeon]|jgi:riboflavin synthase|nr:riboflavin synthase subunit alpha [Candidatus Thalassarchaeaceae archaeon]|tara:strand:+ start:27666 stop:28268 length:603 start_codon:yes stop_codon:yes gene_type:complete
MYTGIVAGTAPVSEIKEGEGVRTLSIDLDGYSDGLEVGASVALDGVCMTVVSMEGTEVQFDAIEETLQRTTLGEITSGEVVNVERSLRVGDEIGGHILSGHIMTTAKIARKENRGEGLDIIVENPDRARPFILEKGFIGIDGMSLTIGEVSEEEFALHIIPETLRITTIGLKEVGDRVNLEVDSHTQAVVETMLRMEGGL